MTQPKRRNVPGKYGAVLRPVHFTLPVRIAGPRPIFEDVLKIEDWFVGVGKKNFYAPRLPFDSLASSPGNFLEQILRFSATEYSSAAMRRNLLRWGPFDRRWPLRVCEIVKSRISSVSETFRREIKEQFPNEDTKLHLENEPRILAEFKLLRILVELLSELRKKTNPILLEPLLKKGFEATNDVGMHLIPTSFDVTSDRVIATPKEIADFDRMQIETVETMFSAESLGVGLSKEKRLDCIKLISNAFEWGMSYCPTTFDLINGMQQHGLILETRDVRSLLYACLLATMSTEWKKCERKDCSNLFQVTGRRTKYCDWYCGHIESVRRSRKLSKKAR